MNKSPAFQFYVKDWLASQSVTCMTPEQRGAYIQLMCYAWNSENPGTLVNDDSILAVLSGLNERWKLVGGPVKKMFKISGRNLYHPRLVEERKKQIERSDKCKKAGKISAIKRLGSPTDVQHKSNSSSSSSTASSTSTSTAKDIKEKTHERVRLESEFEKFWSIYPSRKNKKLYKTRALAWWLKNVKLPEQYIDAVTEYAKHCKSTNTYPCDAHRFLGDGLWLDFVPKEMKPSPLTDQMKVIFDKFGDD